MNLSDNFKKFMGLDKPDAIAGSPPKPTPQTVMDNPPKAGLDKDKIAGMAMDFLHTTPAGLGIMLGEAGMKRLAAAGLGDTVKKFTSRFFGNRGEINLPQQTLTKLKSGELDTRLNTIFEKKTELTNKYLDLVDSLPSDAFTKDFSIDYTKLSPELTTKIQKASDAIEAYRPKISDVLNPSEFKDLHTAHPEIFDYPLHIVDRSGNVGGSFMAQGSSGSLEINKALVKPKSAETVETLMHELQHAVQQREYLSSSPERSFAVDYSQEFTQLKRRGSTNPKDISWEAEAYDSGLRDAYPELRALPIETLQK